MTDVNLKPDNDRIIVDQDHYQYFCSQCISNGDSPIDIPSLENYQTFLNDAKEDPTLKAYRSGGDRESILGGLMSNPAIRRAVGRTAAEVSKRGKEEAGRMFEKLKTDAKQKAYTKVEELFGDTGGNSGTGPGGSGTPGDPYLMNRMNLNPKPVQVRLSTPIKNPAYGDYYPESRSGLAVMEIIQLKTVVPNSVVTRIKAFFDKVVAFNFQNKAQSEVSFNVDAITKFSADNLRNWFTRYIDAYAKYVFYTSLLSYSNQPLQTNEGMRKLRSFMTPALFDDLSQLENALMGTPCPPELREIIHFIYGAPFKTSSLPGSNIRMICPTTLQLNIDTNDVPYATGFPTNDIRNSIDNLFEMRTTTALVARVFPSWIPGTAGVAAGAGVPEYSPNWHTFYENAPYNSHAPSQSEKWGPQVNGQQEDVFYSSSADILDGAVVAMFSGYDLSQSEANPLDNYAPGMTLPAASAITTSAGVVKSNRLSFVLTSGETAGSWRLSPSLANSQEYARGETQTVTSQGNVRSIVWPGREIINNVNIYSSRQSLYSLFQLIYQAYPGSGRRESNNRSSSRSSYKGKSKKKFNSRKELDTMDED